MYNFSLWELFTLEASVDGPFRKRSRKEYTMITKEVGLLHNEEINIGFM